MMLKYLCSECGASPKANFLSPFIFALLCAWLLHWRGGEEGVLEGLLGALMLGGSVMDKLGRQVQSIPELVPLFDTWPSIKKAQEIVQLFPNLIFISRSQINFLQF